MSRPNDRFISLQVDFEAGVIRLDVGTTKNNEGREIPFDVVPGLVTAFREQRDYTTKIERATGQICPWVFHREGRRIKRMDVARQSTADALASSVRTAARSCSTISDEPQRDV